MPKTSHDQAVCAISRIYERMDSGQLEEVKFLTGNQEICLEYLVNLVMVSEYLWHGKRGDFEMLVGIQPVSPFDYSTWILTTEGIRENLKWFLRELRGALEYGKSVCHGEYRLIAIMPEWFTAGHKLAERFGFTYNHKSNHNFAYSRMA